MSSMIWCFPTTDTHAAKDIVPILGACSRFALPHQYGFAIPNVAASCATGGSPCRVAGRSKLWSC